MRPIVYPFLTLLPIISAAPQYLQHLELPIQCGVSGMNEIEMGVNPPRLATAAMHIRSEDTQLMELVGSCRPTFVVDFEAKPNSTMTSIPVKRSWATITLSDTNVTFGTD